MKPIKLEISGLNSFETKQILDFNQLGNGVFGIFGNTGSGKSTILDAITLALYGEVERSKQNIDFINTKTKKATVCFDFEIATSNGNKTYSIKRVFSIKKNGKDVDSTATLFVVNADDEKEVLEEGVTKVNAKIFEIIGLGVKEFSKCIALPQGEFSAFLKAKPSERTEIMSNIFDLSCYGEKLQAQVKNKLQEYNTLLTVNKSNLELVSSATDEKLKEINEQKEEVTKKYKQVSEILNKKSNEYAEKKNSLEKQNKLISIEKELSSLLEQEEDFKELEKELEKNQNANEIKTDYEKLKQNKIDVKELTEKLANLNELKLKSKTDYEVAEREFNDFKSIFNEKSVELSAKLARLEDLSKFDKEEKELEAEKEKVLVEKEAKRKNLNDLMQSLAFIQTNLTNLEDKIKAIDEYVEKNKADVELSYSLEQTKDIESEIMLIDEFYKRVETLFDQTQEDLKAVQEEYNSAILDEKNLASQRDKIQNTIEVAFEDADSTSFKKLRSCDKELEGMCQVEVQVKNLEETIAKLDLDTENRMATVMSLDSKIVEIESKITQKENEIAEKEQQIANIRVEREEIMGDGVISLISQHLKIGETCPVCNSTVVHKNYIEKIDLNTIDGELEKAQTELKGLRFERDKLFVEGVSLKSRYEFEKAQIEINKNEIKSLQEGKNKLYQKFVDNNENSEENFVKLKELLKTSAEKLEELINLQDAIRDAELRMKIEKAQSGTKITIYKNYLESLIDIIYDLQKKKAEREFVILNSVEGYENLEDYKKKIAEGKSLEIKIQEQKELKVKFRDDQYRINNEKAEIEKNIALINSNIDVLDEKLQNIEKQIASLKSKIVTSGVPEGVSLDDEKSTINTSIAELKFENENKETKVYSLRDNLSRIENEYEIKHSILQNKKKEIDEIEIVVNNILINCKFKSNEDLEANFVDSSVLKIKQSKLLDYQNKVKVLEIQQNELKNEIKNIANDEEVEKLKVEIESLNIEVKELSESVGKVNADYSRIVEDNKKFNQFSENIEIFSKKYDLVKELYDVFKGKALAEYVAEEYLQEITISANDKLSLLMDGKYNLKFINKEFVVEDNFENAILRPASTLSGGETFLVSLSLALSISEAISMLSSRSMDFFFLDEGFGTLDDSLCSAVVNALYKLESQNLRIGLITHVKELEESIKNKVLVLKDNNGSHIKIEHSL